jgi:hypothetical protein
MLNAVMLTVVILSVVAPHNENKHNNYINVWGIVVMRVVLLIAKLNVIMVIVKAPLKGAMPFCQLAIRKTKHFDEGKGNCVHKKLGASLVK